MTEKLYQRIINRCWDCLHYRNDENNDSCLQNYKIARLIPNCDQIPEWCPLPDNKETSK